MGIKEQMKVISVNAGEPKTVMIDGKPLTTGIYKEPVSEPLFVTKLNFNGDGQADLVHHGGYDKAIKNEMTCTTHAYKPLFYNASSFCK